MPQTSLACAVPSALRDNWHAVLWKETTSATCHKATHQSRVDLFQLEILLPAYFVGVSRVVNPFVVVSCLTQSVCWLLQASLSLLPSDGYTFTSHPGSWKLFGNQDALLLCKAVLSQGQDKGAGHSLLHPTSGTTLPLSHKGLGRLRLQKQGSVCRATTKETCQVPAAQNSCESRTTFDSSLLGLRITGWKRPLRSTSPTKHPWRGGIFSAPFKLSQCHTSHHKTTK